MTTEPAPTPTLGDTVCPQRVPLGHRWSLNSPNLGLVHGYCKDCGAEKDFPQEPRTTMNPGNSPTGKVYNPPAAPKPARVAPLPVADRVYRCPECDEECESGAGLASHRRSAHPAEVDPSAPRAEATQVHPCYRDGCEALFGTAERLRTHISNVHPASGEPTPQNEHRAPVVAPDGGESVLPRAGLVTNGGSSGPVLGAVEEIEEALAELGAEHAQVTARLDAIELKAELLEWARDVLIERRQQKGTPVG